MEIKAAQEHVYAGEHLSRILRVTTDADLTGKTVKLCFSTPAGRHYLSEALTMENGEGSFRLPAALLDAGGTLLAQAVVSAGADYCEKSRVYAFEVERAVEEGGQPDASGLVSLSSVYDALLEVRRAAAALQTAKADRTDTVLDTSLSMGRSAGSAVGQASVALGAYNVSSAHATAALGSHCEATAENAVASGYYNASSGVYAFTENARNEASGMAAHAEGIWNKAAGACQHVQGKYNVEDANGVYAHIVGNGTGTDARSNCHTLDWDGNAWFAGDVEAAGLSVGRAANTTAGAASVAAGRGVEASGVRSQAFGDGTEASGDDSHAEGFLSKARSECAHAEGWAADALGKAAHAEGCFTETASDYAHAEGYSAYAGGEASHAEGNTSSAGGAASHAEGSHTNAAGPAQHVQGRYNVADAAGTYAHIVGNGTGTDARSNCHTLDWNGNAWYAGDVTCAGVSAGRTAGSVRGSKSTVLGAINTATAYASAAIGSNCDATGENAVAAGYHNLASGVYSFAENARNDATGTASHAEGLWTKAAGACQHVQGKYNVEDAAGTYAHIVGNGAGTGSRSNCHTLDWSGNAWFAGGIELNDTATGTRYRIRVTNGQLVLTALS